MEKFTLEELREFYNSKGYITEERFYTLFNVRKGFDIDVVRQWYKVFMNFPYNLHNVQEEAEIKFIMQVVTEYINERKNSFVNRMPYRYERKTNSAKIIYKENQTTEELKEIELDLSSSEDILTYSDIIKRGEVVLHLHYVDKHYISKQSKDLIFYEGDTYHSKDDFWGNKKGNVYVATGNCFKRLNYIRGVGYVDGDGKPNYDGSDGSFTSYAIAGYKYEKMGNIHIDINFLKD